MTITTHKTKEIEIGVKVSLLIGYDEKIDKFPFRIEECHGIHVFSEDEITYSLSSVELVVAGVGIDVLKSMNYKMIERIKDLLQD